MRDDVEGMAGTLTYLTDVSAIFSSVSTTLSPE
jgi:hypothetical protein